MANFRGKQLDGDWLRISRSSLWTWVQKKVKSDAGLTPEAKNDRFDLFSGRRAAIAHPALIVTFSPAFLGPLAPVGLAEPAVSVPPVAIVETLRDNSNSVIPINWTLAATLQQEAGQGSAGPDDNPDEGQDPESVIVVEGLVGPTETDPMGAVNETSFRITQSVDAAVVEPLAYAYRDGLPGPIRQGLGNVVHNLSEPANFLNFLLQLKVGDAIETLARFSINSTLGLGGLIDVAAMPGINLPYRRNGFANTLGFYGVEQGAYLYLPITGPTTLRDLIGNSLDQAVVPFVVGAPFDRIEYAAPVFVVTNLNARLEIDEELGRIEETSDPYAVRRDTYLYRRERDIALLRGEEPPPPPPILREIEEGLDAFDEELERELNEEVPPTAEPERPVAITRPVTR